MSAYHTPAALLRARLLASCAAAIAFSAPALAQTGFKAAPETVVGGIETSQGQAIAGGLRDTVQVFTRQSVINWTPEDTATGGGAIAILPQGNELVFTANPDDVGGAYTVLNRIIPNDPSRAVQFDGLVKSQFDAGYGATTGGNIWFYSPGGIIAGATSRFDVGSLVLSANDIDFSGGLFGDGTESQAGTIRFRGAADSKSFITIQPGAQLNAAGNYLALVAPRITQGGALSVHGGAALVAAESADITIPVSGGLFDISVSVGSAVDASGGTTLSHTGSTALSDPQGTGEARRVYLVAVPKNDAVTMLVSGSAGYDAASQAVASNGSIFLVAGQNASVAADDTANFGAGPNAIANVSGAAFAGNVNVIAPAAVIDASAASSSVTGDLFVNANLTTVTATNGFAIGIGGNSRFFIGPTSITAANGGRIAFDGGISIESDLGGGTDPIVGETLSLTVDNGTVTSGGDLVIRSVRRGGYSDGTAGDATGGSTTVSVLNGGQLGVAGEIRLQSLGFGGESGYGAAGAGFGGTASLNVASGSNVATGSIFIQSNGVGGRGVSTGGTGAGGIAAASIDGGSLTTGELGSATLEATGEGGEANGGAAGLGRGGTAQLLVGGAGSSAAFTSGLTLAANGFGGGIISAATGGDAVGGSATISGGPGLLAISVIEGRATRLEATATGGFGLVRSGNAAGGTMAIGLNGTTADLGDVSLNAKAGTTDVANADVSFPPEAENGGDATGGNALLSFTNAAVTLGRLDLSLAGEGGRGLDQAGGNGTGGTGSLAVTGGTLNLTEINATADGLGGGSLNGFGTVALGGIGTGGSLSVSLSGTTVSEIGNLFLSASGEGGDGFSAGDGVGGTVSLASANGTNLQILQSFELLAGGTGSDGFDSGGSAFGGRIDLAADGGTVGANFVGADASGRAGYAYGASSEGARTLPGFAGSATGGTITLLSKAGGLVTASGDYLVNADGGTGYSGTGAGQATGGTITVTAAGGGFDFTANTTRFEASGQAGASFESSFRPTGQGGTIDFQLMAGAASDPASSLRFDTLLLTANGSIVDLSDGGFAPGNGGTGIGGSVDVTISAGQLDGTALELTADGFGGIGPQGGKAGAGLQGRAAFTMTGGGATLEDNLRLYARAWGGTAPGEESGYGAAGLGGDAGVGTNPLGSGAGAIASLSGNAQLTASGLEIIGDSLGGNGGNTDQFAFDPGNAGAGGDAAGGIATLSSAGSSVLTVSSLTLSVKGTGGDGGSVEYGYGSSFSGGASGGAGGRGTGGIATARLESIAALNAPAIEANARGIGGAGGSVFAFDAVLQPGSGSGGRGGAGTGGTAQIILASDSIMPAVADALGIGGNGGTGLAGGSGGAGQGGSAFIDIIGGNHSFDTLLANAQGFGGSGASADMFEGGRGGDATGGNARLRMAGGSSTAAGLEINAAAIGGRGGLSGMSFNAVPPAGGDGGAATGGDAALLISGGRVEVSGTESSVTLSADGYGGDGGSGGYGGSQGDVLGIGGTGGIGRGGSTLVNATGGTALFTVSRLSASGIGGLGGGESGYGQIVGTGGAGQGGGVTLLADGAAVSLNLGQAELSADGNSSAGQDVPGAILIQANTTGSSPVLTFNSLDAHARGSVLDPENSAGIETRASGAPISVTTSASYDSLGPVDFVFDGAGGLAAAGTVVITSSDSITVQHSNPGGASISGSAVFAQSDGAITTGPGSLLRGGESVEARSYGGSVSLAAVEAARFNVGAAFDATIGSFTGGDATIFAGQADSESQVFGGRNAAITGDWRLTGSASVGATGDIVIAPAAQIVVDRAATFDAGDDIIIGSGARVRAANNAPPESGYGASDPLQQAAQLRLLAGGIYAGSPIDGQLGSILIDGTLEAPERTIFMRAGAVSGSAASQLTAGNLYVRLSNIPAGDQVPLNDGGQLTGACLEGSVCLGAANISNIVRIGESGFEPVNLRLAGGIDARDVLLRARSIELGQMGTAGIVRASDSLIIESTDDNLILNGPLAITGGSALARIATAGSIDGVEASLTAPGALDLFAGSDIRLGGIEAATIRTIGFDGTTLNASGITTPGSVTIGRLATAGTLTVDADQGITLGSLATDGTASLVAASGAVIVSEDAAAIGGVTASGRSVSLTGINGLNVTAANATEGNVTLTSTGGGVTLDQASASGALTVTSPGTIAVNGTVTAGTIAFASNDLAIGSGGQLGSTQTSSLTLTSTADRLLLGDAMGDGYRIDNDEFARIATGGDLTIASAPTSAQSAAFALLDPAAANIVIGSMIFDGTQLGPNGTFSVNTPRSIGITGTVQYRNFGSGQTVTYSALNDISLAAETGVVTVKDSAGGLAGTLRLEAQQVHAMSARARSEIAGLQLNGVRQRLGTNDQLENNGGYFQAGRIIARIGRLLFIQNSGANSDNPDDRRGFSTDNLTIESTGNGPVQVVVNGRVGATTGAGVIPTTTLVGSFDPQSTINGCPTGASCTAEPPPPEPAFDPAPILASSRDQVRSEEGEDEKEEALQASQTRPDPVIQFVEVPPSRFDPLIDEPVTGAGNEDLWLTPQPNTPKP